jgi:hypothetical protein
MTTRETIKQGIADLTWWMQWSDHVEEHGCCNLSGCEISELAPETPPEYSAAAEIALAEVEAKLSQCYALQQAVCAALGHADADSDQATEARTSQVCGALLAAALADGDASLYDDQEYAQRFGHCIAYALSGAGVSWSDDHAEIPLPDLYDTSMSDRLDGLATSLCGVDTTEPRSWPT